MTNTTLLKKKIDTSGYKVIFLAEKVGLTPQGFYKKLKDGSEWTFSQVMILKDLLHLTNEEVDSIFFNEKVE
jgi:DNA-binding phage protein